MDFCAKEENINRAMNDILDNLKLQSHPMTFYED
jgi:hypothetical protein